jgi:predicted NBD/HSP70 family sugar kinase
MDRPFTARHSYLFGSIAKGISFELTDRERWLLALLRKLAPCSRAVLIKASGLSGPAIFRATEDLATKGYIEIGEAIAAGRGQPSNEVRLKENAAISLGVSVTSDFAQAAIMDLSGHICVTKDVTAPDMRLDAILEATKVFLNEQMRDHFVGSTLTGIGLAVAGFFIGDGQKLNPVPQLDDWAMVELAPIWEAHFGVPVIVENIASAAAVGESLVGAGQRFNSFGYVNFAFGFGGGVVLDGRLWRGKSGNAGEFAAILGAAGAFVPTLESLRLHLNDQGENIASLLDLLSWLEQHAHNVDAWGAPWIKKASHSIALLAEILNGCVDVDALVLGGRLPFFLASKIAERASQQQLENRKPVRRGHERPIMEITAAEVSGQSAVIGAAALPLTARIFRPVTNLLP